ncbi:hypothetical protein AMJ80_03570 [bacterium SM23_31]|nr:MAG: hypothetical protein AMJ80_03570 [bacterium SM23_31]
MISFISTSCNRLEHTQLTLEHNINIAKDHEIVLLNYGDKDGLDDYIKENFMEHIEKRRLKYYRVNEKYFHMSKAKNLGHRLAMGEFLFQLDIDTFIYERIINDCYKALELNGYACPYFTDNMIYGLSADNFFKLGGYDERFEGWGTEDTDLAMRCKHAGIVPVNVHVQSIKQIDHSDDLRFRSFAPEYQSACYEDSLKIYNEHKEQKTTYVNKNGFSKFKVIKNFTEEIIV